MEPLYALSKQMVLNNKPTYIEEFSIQKNKNLKLVFRKRKSLTENDMITQELS
jgi:hypothetical protein